MIIYKVTNLLNGRVYIGQTTQKLRRRWKSHKGHRKDGNHQYITRAIHKYGVHNFKIEQIDSALTLSELNDKEIYYITLHNSLAPNGYNLESGGRQNMTYSEETKKRMSTGQKLRFQTQPHPLAGVVGRYNHKSKPVLCTTTGEQFESARQAALYYKVHRSHVNEIARGNPGRKSTKGYKFIYIDEDNNGKR